MSAVTCLNPACKKSVTLPDTAPAGHVYGCPHCKQALPAVPDKLPLEVDYASLTALILACSATTLLFSPSFILLTPPVAIAGLILAIHETVRRQRLKKSSGMAVTALVFAGIALLIGLIFAIRADLELLHLRQEIERTRRGSW